MILDTRKMETFSCCSRNPVLSVVVLVSEEDRTRTDGRTPVVHAASHSREVSGPSRPHGAERTLLYR